MSGKLRNAFVKSSPPFIKDTSSLPSPEDSDSPSLSHEADRQAARRAATTKIQELRFIFIHLVSNVRWIADEANVYASRHFEVQKKKFIFLLFFIVFLEQILLFFAFFLEKNIKEFTGLPHHCDNPAT